LGHLILGALFVVIVLNVGNYNGLHKFFDESRFARADGAYHAYVNIPGRAGGYVAVNIAHFGIPPKYFCLYKNIFAKGKKYAEKGNFAKCTGNRAFFREIFVLGFLSRGSLKEAARFLRIFPLST
jgi:hypothetical protein